MSIKFATTLSEKEKCYEVLKQLRPHLVDKIKYLEQLLRMEKTNAYRLIIYQENDKVLALAGIRSMETFFQGKVLYVDDLITLESERSKGCGGKLMEFIKKYVKEEKFNALTLDSGVQRFEAHKFYFKHDFYISTYHFNCKL